AKGAKTAIGLGRGAKKGAEVTTAFGRGTTAPKLQKAGEGLRRTSTISPRSSLETAGQQKELLDVTGRLPGLRGSGAKKFRNVETELGKQNSEVSHVLKGGSATMPGTNFNRAIADSGDSITDPAERKAFANVLNAAYNKVFGGDVLPDSVTATQVNAL